MSPTSPRRRSVLRSISAVAAAAVLIVTVGGYAAARRWDGKIQRVPVFSAMTGGAERPVSAQLPVAGLEPMNVLLVGIDNREGLTREQRAAWHLGQSDYGNQTDTIMVVHIGRDAEHVTVVSLPRDSLVTVPEYTDENGTTHSEHHDKINAAFTLGGPSLLVSTVERATGITIDHYVGVSFSGFVGMVNAVDGVEVCLTEPIKDNPKYTSLDLPAGKSTLRDGMALSFVRARHVGTDFGRIQRQQQFMASLLKKATSIGVVGNPVRLDGFVSSVAESLQVDETLDRAKMAELANRLSGVRLDQIEFARLPIADDNYTDPDTGRGGYVLWGKKGSRDIFDALITDTPLVVKTPSTPKPTPTLSPNAATVEPRDIEIKVFNASGTAGRAKDISGELQDLGFIVDSPDSYDDRLVDTVVRYDPTEADALKTVRQVFPEATFTAVPDLGVTFEVIIGSSFGSISTPTVTPVPPTPTYSESADPSDISVEQKPVLADTTVCQ